MPHAMQSSSVQIGSAAQRNLRDPDNSGHTTRDIILIYLMMPERNLDTGLGFGV